MSIPRIQTMNSTPLRCSRHFGEEMKLSLSRREAYCEDSKSILTKSSSKKAINENCKIAGRAASLYAKDFDKNSNLQLQMREVDGLRWSDLEVGTLLGRGAFSHVHEVSLRDKGDGPPTLATGQDNSDASLETAEIFSESFNGHDAELYENLNIEVSGTGISFALKCIDPQHLKGKRDFSNCAIDIVMEAKVLACLSHPNIIKLHAVTAGSVSRAFTRRRGYFLILDRVQGTLDERILTWADDESAMSKVERIVRLDDRLKSVVLGVVRGMKYLHKNMVIYRDLKPSNIGFTRSGEVKLFDFGLAREVLDPLRRLTGYTGSARYMAPEVARSDFYGFPADVYSFAILLWEVCSLGKAYAGMSKQEHLEMVVGAQVRPKLSSLETSSGVKKLIHSCWRHDPNRRPKFRGILIKLCSEMVLGNAPHGSFNRDHTTRLRKHRGGSIDKKLTMSLPSAFESTDILNADRSP